MASTCSRLAGDCWSHPRNSELSYAEIGEAIGRNKSVVWREVNSNTSPDGVYHASVAHTKAHLVERSTRFTILLHLPGDHTADAVAAAMIQEMGKLPDHLRRSITWDRGTELAEYARIQIALDTTLYFCDPHSPWQRGSNEDTTGS